MTVRSKIYALTTAVAAGLGAGVACADDTPERPRDPWVFRSVLDGRARMLTCELSPKLLIAYDTQTASLRLAWSGDVLFTGGVYDARHGPQPKSVGRAYFSAKGDDTAWSVTQAGKLLARTPPRYLGYRVTDNGVKIEYAVDTPGGRLTVTESPESDVNNDRAALTRTFVVKGLPPDTTLTLDLVGGDNDPPAEHRVKALAGGDVAALDATGRSVTCRGDGTFAVETTWSLR